MVKQSFNIYLSQNIGLIKEKSLLLTLIILSITIIITLIIAFYKNNQVGILLLLWSYAWYKFFILYKKVKNENKN